MEENLFQITSEKKHFKYLGYILISLSVILIINIFSYYDLKEFVSQSFGIGISIVIGIYLVYRGSSKFSIKLTSKKLNYISKTNNHEINIEDISIIKSFQEVNKNSSNLVIFLTEEDFVSFSSAFIDINYLKDLYNKLYILCKDNENIKFEDDLNWLNIN